HRGTFAMKMYKTWLITVLFTFCGTADMEKTHLPPTPVTDALTVPIAEARKLINESQVKVAIEKLSALPNQADIRVIHLLGVAYYQLGDHARAIGLLTQVWDNLPANSPSRREAIEILGVAHYLVGHIADSLPFLEQTKAWAADNMELAYITGVAYIGDKQPLKARESFARMFKTAPDSATAHLITAQMMLRFKADGLAEEELKRAAEKDPKLAGTHFWLGQLAIRRERYDEAVALLEKELAVNPSNGMVYYLLGETYTRQSKWDEALMPLRKAIWLEPYFAGSYVLIGKI